MDKPIDYYKDPMRIYNAFPQFLEAEVADVIEILNFKPDVLSPDQFEVTILGESIKIPPRVYFDEPSEDKLQKLSDVQKVILSCIFTRHHDGHVREKYLRKIILSENKWVIPYIFQLIGEYVIEILSVIYENREKLDPESYSKFLKDNKLFFSKTKKRVRSYWDCYYYRSNPKYDDYVGKKILDHFDEILKIKLFKYFCPCCGYDTLDEKPPATYNICKICFWEDDNFFDGILYEGGANHVGLLEARKNFEEFGACEKRVLKYVRKPTKDDERNTDWKSLGYPTELK